MFRYSIPDHFSLDFACHQPVISESCHSFGTSQFSTVICTNDFNELTATLFGTNNPYVIEQASSSWSCSTESVTTYSANGFCHFNPIDGTSFRAKIDPQGTLLFYKYSDSACVNNRDAASFYQFALQDQSCRSYECNLLPSLCSRQDCSFASLCTRSISVGGPFGAPPSGKLSVLVEFENDSCSAPATSMTFTKEQSCAPQIDHYNPVCMKDGTVSDCTQYIAGSSDDIGIIDEAFGDYPHLIVEKYVWCGFVDTVTDVKVYRLDENCYSNAAGTESHKLTLGWSITITTYTDAKCLNIATETTVGRQTILAGGCGNGDEKFLANAQNVLKAIAVFEESKCSGTPSHISFVPTFGCQNVVQDFVNGPCESIGNSLFSMSSCTNDYKSFAVLMFGIDFLFLIEEGFSNSFCMEPGVITTYSADDVCHIRPGDSRSFKATVNSAGQLVLSTFDDLKCENRRNTAILFSSPYCLPESCDLIPLCSLDICYSSGCSRKLSIGGGLDPGVNVVNSAVTVFKDKSCTVPIQIVIKKQLSCSPVSKCNAVPILGTTLYQDHACVEDVAAFSESRFNGVPYVIMEQYKDRSNCETQKRIVVYKADGMCHRVADGTSFRVLPSYGGSITLAFYPTKSCDNNEAEIVSIGIKYFNTRACYNGNMRLYGDLTALPGPAPILTPTCPTLTPAPIPTTSTPISSVDIDQKTREEIMFPAWLWEPTPRRIFQDA